MSAQEIFRMRQMCFRCVVVIVFVCVLFNALKWLFGIGDEAGLIIPHSYITLCQNQYIALARTSPVSPQQILLSLPAVQHNDYALVTVMQSANWAPPMNGKE